MKFREEYKLIFPMNPDIIIIQECEDLRNIHFDLFSNSELRIIKIFLKVVLKK